MAKETDGNPFQMFSKLAADHHQTKEMNDLRENTNNMTKFKLFDASRFYRGSCFDARDS